MTCRRSTARGLFLTHYPVADADIAAVESPRGSVLDPASYEIENASGKLRIARRMGRAGHRHL